jgi:hypothetical protein
MSSAPRVAPVCCEGDVDANGLAVRQVFLVCASLAIVAAACSGGPMSETEYVEGLNALVVKAGSELGDSLAAYEQIADPTLEDFLGFVEQQLIVEYEVRDTFDTFEPPDSVDAVNQVMVDTLTRILAASEGLVDIADTVNSLEEIEQTAEFAEYQGINAESDSSCLSVQAQLNNLSTRPVIDSPWLADLQRTVQAFLDCGDVATG